MEWAELVHGIRVEPEPDAPRLVAADWLSDRADVRGEYIAIACRLASGEARKVDPEGELQRRSYAIDRSTAWQAAIVKLGAVTWRGGSPDFEYRRGFIESIALVGPAVVNFAAICALEPILELEIRDVRGGGAALAEAPALAQLQQLSLGDLDPIKCEALLASGLLGGVRRLVSELPISTQIAQALARGAMRPRRLSATCEEAGTRVLARHDVLRELTSFEQWHATDALLEALAEAPLANLRGLALWDPAITARGLDALGPRLANLERLTLRSLAPFDPQIAACLIRHITTGRLRSLELDGFDDAELVALLRSPVLAGVEVLRINGSSIEIRDALEVSQYCMSVREVSGSPGGGLIPRAGRATRSGG